jgi:hypothetical protein
MSRKRIVYGPIAFGTGPLVIAESPLFQEECIRGSLGLIWLDEKAMHERGNGYLDCIRFTTLGCGWWIPTTIQCGGNGKRGAPGRPLLLCPRNAECIFLAKRNWRE